MYIPRAQKALKDFVSDLVVRCRISRMDRLNRGQMFKSYAEVGADNQQNAALYNKTYAYLDDLESLLYSPVSLRFKLSDPDIPNILNMAKGRAAAARLRTQCRRAELDTMFSAAVKECLVKGKSFIKMNYKGGELAPVMVQPEAMGVLYEVHQRLDQNMEAFVHTMMITPYQLARLVERHPRKDDILREAKNYMRSAQDMPGTEGAQRQVVVGGLYPFQPAGSGSPNGTRGIVDWLSTPAPLFSPKDQNAIMDLHELWVWDDRREDWATFQQLGDGVLIGGDLQIANAFALDRNTAMSAELLKGKHPFVEFCANPTENYFWGRSEVVNVALLQEAINSRINGIGRLLRKQEDPPTKFVSATGVNQDTLARYNKPGGYWTDLNPQAKIDKEVTQVPPDLWNSLHEYERMFDEMGGLPPIARGHGDAGVRSHGHAEALIRMFSPRFKDRALLIERDVEAAGGLMLDMEKLHAIKKLVAWVPKEAAGVEASPIDDPLIVPPAPGLVPVWFRFSDLDDDVTLSVDSHSSSPAFAQEARALAFDLLKVGAMDQADVLERSDVSDPEELIQGVTRRNIAKAAAEKQEQDQKFLAKAGGHH